MLEVKKFNMNKIFILNRVTIQVENENNDDKKQNYFNCNAFRSIDATELNKIFHIQLVLKSTDIDLMISIVTANLTVDLQFQ